MNPIKCVFDLHRFMGQVVVLSSPNWYFGEGLVLSDGAFTMYAYISAYVETRLSQGNLAIGVSRFIGNNQSGGVHAIEYNRLEWYNVSMRLTNPQESQWIKKHLLKKTRHFEGMYEPLEALQYVLPIFAEYIRPTAVKHRGDIDIYPFELYPRPLICDVD